MRSPGLDTSTICHSSNWWQPKVNQSILRGGDRTRVGKRNEDLGVAPPPMTGHYAPERVAATTAVCPSKAAGDNMGEIYTRCRHQLFGCLELAAHSVLWERSCPIGILSEPPCEQHVHFMRVMGEFARCQELFRVAATWDHIREEHELWDVLTDMTNCAALGLGCTAIVQNTRRQSGLRGRLGGRKRARIRGMGLVLRDVGSESQCFGPLCRVLSGNAGVNLMR